VRENTSAGKIFLRPETERGGSKAIELGRFVEVRREARELLERGSSSPASVCRYMENAEAARGGRLS
jgi:hypothetical protein